MPRNSFVDRVFHGGIAVLLLVLGVYLIVDSARNQGFGLGASSRVLILAVVMILGLLAALRERGGGGADDETRADELRAF
jgi:hypothetical protein